MSEEDEDDSDSEKTSSHSESSDSEPPDDLGKVVSKVLNSAVVNTQDPEVFNELIDSTKDINPDPHLFLIEPANPNIQMDFSKAREIVESIKAMSPAKIASPDNSNPGSYQTPVYGTPEEKEYKPAPVEEKIPSESYSEKKDYVSDKEKDEGEDSEEQD